MELLRDVLMAIVVWIFMIFQLLFAGCQRFKEGRPARVEITSPELSPPGPGDRNRNA